MANFDPRSINEEPLVYFSDNTPAARIGLTMTFYFGRGGLPERRQALVRHIEDYLQQAKGQFQLYAVKGDRQYRTLVSGEMPDFSLIEAMAGPRGAFEFEAGVEEDISHSWSIAALSKNFPRPTVLGYLLLTYPLAILNQMSGLDGFIQQFVSISDSLEVEQAYAGLGLVLPFNVGGARAANEIIGNALVQYPGLDAYNTTGVCIHCEHGIKSINFLTAVSHPLLEKAGGADAVVAQAGPTTLTCRYSNGVVFQAGEIPQLGSPNQPPAEYVALGRALKAARAPYPSTMFYDPIGRRDIERDDAFTQRWLGRFDG